MTLHKFTNTPSPFGFVAEPVQFTANTPGNISLFATGYGRVLNNTGTRIWDTSVTPATINASLTAGQSLTLPFSANFLPSFLFDAIIVVIVNGSLILPYGFSNSADNATVTSAVTDKKLYWLDLRCFNILGSGNPAGSNNYLFGGNPTTAPNELENYNVNFAVPTEGTLNYTVNITYSAYLLGPHPIQYNASGTIPAGVTSHTFFSGRLGDLFVPGYVPFSNRGFYTVTFTITTAGYTSLLNKYHWGVG